MLLDNGFESFVGDMGVNLGGGDVGVSKQHLDGSQICAVID